ncbi:hypothetical protein Q604_UNBC01470G0001, partial [human gut metagenome]
ENSSLAAAAVDEIPVFHQKKKF